MAELLTVVALAGMLAAGSGCVAFNVGKPEVFTHTETVVTTNQTPSRTEVLFVEAKAQAGGSRLTAWLEADVQEEFPRWAHEEITTVTIQKRLSVGLFPGAGEIVYHSPGTPLSLGTYVRLVFMPGLIPELGFNMSLATVQSLFFAPFGKWGECGDAQWAECAKKGFTHWGPNDGGIWRIEHFGLVGVHKNLRKTKTGPIRVGPNRDAGGEKKRRTESVKGPYEVELRIPGAGVSDKATVWAGSSNATFTLPQVDYGGSYEATLVFQSLYTGTKDAVRKSWKAKVLKTTVWLAEKPKPAPVAVYTPQTQPVREVHHYHETRVEVEKKPEGVPWDIETVEPFQNGRAVYLVTIRDASKKAFEVEREVRPDIERNLREAFMASMPGMDEKSVAVTVVAEYEGRSIRFRGVAFSVQPLTDRWTYDEETRRGTVRLRISEGMTPDEAKRWARENIEAIVREKNVALEAGAALPSGAVYRSLGETLEGGVLTVEFEAVE